MKKDRIRSNKIKIRKLLLLSEEVIKKEPNQTLKIKVQIKEN
jgi:hypothetical protein